MIENFTDSFTTLLTSDRRPTFTFPSQRSQMDIILRDFTASNQKNLITARYRTIVCKQSTALLLSVHLTLFGYVRRVSRRAL